MRELPLHLQKYIVDQNEDKYSPIDHAVWRYVLRQLKNFLGQHAHEAYLSGLEKTGISTEKIPSIDQISEKLSQFGWRALPVSGFIPPAAFMELQSLGVLPIASDMRSLDHLLYTPAPDIVHEAAGHAPLLALPEYANYLKKYAQVAKKALISREDLNIYEAIRVLSDLKEDRSSSAQQIEKAQSDLELASDAATVVSEAAELSRMNWWTAEYGLIGTLENPKIFGAGLLSSVGESKWCLSEKVRKLPLTADCVHQGYDITEPQPQLFVTPDFATLGKVLDDFSETMAYRLGGTAALKKTLPMRTVNTVELNSGLQIAGELTDYETNEKGEVIFIRFKGPTQLSYQDQELKGHSTEYHKEGFSTPLGPLKSSTESLVQMDSTQLSAAGVRRGRKDKIEFASGFVVEGFLEEIRTVDHKNLVLAFKDCRVSKGDKTYFEPAWGNFDLALGESVTSVFAGPADRVAFGATEDFVAKKIQPPVWSEKQIELQSLYQKVREIRESSTPSTSEKDLQDIATQVQQHFPEDWLLSLEILEILEFQKLHSPHFSSLKKQLVDHLKKITQKHPEKKSVVEDGLQLAQNQ